MSYDQPDLFTAQAKSVAELPQHSMSYADATLNYRRYQQEVRLGLCSFDDGDEKQFSTVVECSLPTSANITQLIDQHGFKREINFTIYGREEHKNAGELINWWLEQKNHTLDLPNKQSPAGKWILAHAAEMNSARRYWDAKRKAFDIESIERQIEELQERFRIERLNLAIRVREAAEDRNMTADEKKVYLKELGARDSDL